MRKQPTGVNGNEQWLVEINQMLSATGKQFVKEKQVNLGKNSELCGILTCLSFIPHPQLLSSLEK